MNSTLSLLSTHISDSRTACHPALKQVFIPPFQLALSPCTQAQLLDAIEKSIEPMPDGSLMVRQKTLISPVGLETLQQAQEDLVYRNALNRLSLINLPEGPWVHRLASMAGFSFPEVLSLADWVASVLRLATEKGYSIFILGSEPETLTLAKQQLREREMLPEIAGCWAKAGARLNDPTISRHVTNLLWETLPEIVMVALDSPFHTHWLQNHWSQLPPCILMPVGDSFDVFAGTPESPSQFLHRGIRNATYGLRMLQRVHAFQTIGKRGK